MGCPLGVESMVSFSMVITLLWSGKYGLFFHGYHSLMEWKVWSLFPWLSLSYGVESMVSFSMVITLLWSGKYGLFFHGYHSLMEWKVWSLFPWLSLSYGVESMVSFPWLSLPFGVESMVSFSMVITLLWSGKYGLFFHGYHSLMEWKVWSLFSWLSLSYNITQYKDCMIRDYAITRRPTHHIPTWGRFY